MNSIFYHDLMIFPKVGPSAYTHNQGVVGGMVATLTSPVVRDPDELDRMVCVEKMIDRPNMVQSIIWLPTGDGGTFTSEGSARW